MAEGELKKELELNHSIDHSIETRVKTHPIDKSVYQIYFIVGLAVYPDILGLRDL